MRFAGNKIFLALFIGSILTATQTVAAIQLGIDVLESTGYALLKGKRVGLVTNQTGIDSSGVRTRVLLKKNVNLVALYTPEHGLDGTEKACRYVSSRRDPLTGLIAPLYYAATGLIGELHGPETGVGGARPFEIIAARGVRASTFTNYMNSQRLSGVTFSPYRGGSVGGSYLHIEPNAAANFTAINIYALAEMNRELRTNLIARSSRRKRDMFFKCYGSTSIQSELARGDGPTAIVTGWADDAVLFKGERSRYLLY